jgi:hypothetical protein
MALFGLKRGGSAEGKALTRATSVRDVLPDVDSDHWRAGSGPLPDSGTTRHWHKLDKVEDKNCPVGLLYFTRDGRGSFSPKPMGRSTYLAPTAVLLQGLEDDGKDLSTRLDLDLAETSDHRTQLMDLAELSLTLANRWPDLLAVRDREANRKHQQLLDTLMAGIRQEQSRVASWREQLALESLEGTDFDVDSLDERVRRGSEVARAVTDARRVTLNKWRETPETNSPNR